MTDRCDYVERDGGITRVWHKTRCVERFETRKGTLVEMIDIPDWGISCFMNGVIQSSTCDEAIYHKTFVNAATKQLRADSSNVRVCIFGGGEGAIAREALLHPHVSHVDMIDWDEEVVDLFRMKFTQWGKGAWDDPRLRVQIADAFAVCNEPRDRHYDVVLVDLFDPEDTEEEKTRWISFLTRCLAWTTQSFAMYIGTHAPVIRSRTGIVRTLRALLRKEGFLTKLDYVYVPSFSGYSLFLSGRREGSKV
jgi:predicted membrane-bound spermidine synthase